MIKAIIFDLGGPILEWETSHHAAYRKHEEHRNLERDTIRNLFKDYFRGAHVGDFHGISDFFEKTKPSIDITVEEMNEILSEADSAMYVRPEMIKYIEGLKKKYKIALLSNFTSDLADFLRDVFNIYHLFDLVVSSCDLKIKKPDSRIYSHVLEKLGVRPEEAVFIDDSEKNVEGAEAVGIKGIIFKNFEQCRTDLEKILARNTA